MGKHIVITTINPPSDAIRHFSKIEGYSLVVVGDNKTPQDWKHDNTTYYSLKAQRESVFNLAQLLPENHYCRKNIGYLFAIQAGASVIYDTDDDNIPYEYWSEPFAEKSLSITTPDAGFINILAHYTSQHIWPRGLPLKQIKHLPEVASKNFDEAAKVLIWQGLADNDPDVDAIYRLTNNTPCFFEKKGKLVLNKGTLTPFNSQNTFFSKEAFELLYLPSYVSFRFTDILRGLVAQPILWAKNYHLGYFDATVYQERNPHDYLKDFESEIPCYLYPDKIIKIASEVINANSTLGENLLFVYRALVEHEIVPEKELPLLEAWLKDLTALKADR